MAAVPKGCGPTGRDAALLITCLERPYGAPRALPRSRSDRNAIMIIYQTASDAALCRLNLFSTGC